jgi:hypothetical protein
MSQTYSLSFFKDEGRRGGTRALLKKKRGQAGRGDEGRGAACFGLDWGGRGLPVCHDCVTQPTADRN